MVTSILVSIMMMKRQVGFIVNGLLQLKAYTLPVILTAGTNSVIHLKKMNTESGSYFWLKKAIKILLFMVVKSKHL